jgi:hypothetical protein
MKKAMGFLLWFVETFNWLTFGTLLNFDYIIMSRREYEDYNLDMCFNIIMASDNQTELWVSNMLYGPWFPKCLRAEYFICYYNKN